MNGRILLSKLGGMKKHMDTVFLTMGGILIPLGFYLKLEYPQSDSYYLATTCVIVGAISWLLAYFFVKRKEKREAQERQESRREFSRLLTGIHQELKGLNQGKK